MFLEAFFAFCGAVLLTRNNASPFVHQEMIMGKTAFCLVHSSVPNLLSGTDKGLVRSSVNMVESVVFVSLVAFHYIVYAQKTVANVFLK